RIAPGAEGHSSRCAMCGAPFTTRWQICEITSSPNRRIAKSGLASSYLRVIVRDRAHSETETASAAVARVRGNCHGPARWDCPVRRESELLLLQTGGLASAGFLAAHGLVRVLGYQAHSVRLGRREPGRAACRRTPTRCNASGLCTNESTYRCSCSPRR